MSVVFLSCQLYGNFICPGLHLGSAYMYELILALRSEYNEDETCVKINILYRGQHF